MKLLEKKRDELADQHTNSTYFHLEYSTFGSTARECTNSFRCGFDAAVKELEPVLKEMVEALAWYSDRNNWMRSYVFDTESLVPSAWADKLKSQDCAMLNCGGGRARLALQKYKQLTGGK